MIKLSYCFPRCDKNSWCRFCIMNLLISGWTIISFIYTHHQELTLVAGYLLMIYCSLFIAHISTPALNGPSLSYTMFLSFTNTLLCNAGYVILIHACFCHDFFTCHKHKKMAMFSHIVLQERKCIIYETWWI